MDYSITYREKNNGIQAIISYKDNNGKWKQKSKQGFENNRIGKNKAKEWTLQTLKELESNIQLNKDYESITFKEFFDEYIEHKKVTSTYNNISTYNIAYNHFSALADIQMKDIKPIHIQKCLNEMLKNLKSTSISSMYSKIKAIFNSAVEDYNIITTNPCKAKIKIDKNEKKVKVALTKKDLDILLERMKNGNWDNKYYIITLIASKCGLRVGEIVGLTWNDIDFKNKTININKQWKFNSDGEYTFGKPKSTNSYRIVPMTAYVSKALLEYKKNSPVGLDNRVIDLATTDSAKKNIHRYFKKCGYNITIHELRHTYATTLVAAGLDFKTIARLMGHDVEQTLKTYSHVTDDMMKKARDIINSL